MEEQYGIKELYDITLRLRAPLEIAGKKYDTNEAILMLDKANIATVTESRINQQATGGYHNIPLINWETDKEVNFSITNGLLSPVSWALLSNSKVKRKSVQSVNYIEPVQALCDDDYCAIDLKYKPNAILDLMGVQGNPNNEPLPMGRRPELMLKPLPPSKVKWIFCYDERGNKIKDFEIYGNRVYFRDDYSKVYVDYTFDYYDGLDSIEIGDRLMNGFYSLTGKFSSKAYSDGVVRTGVITIPKCKINNALSMKLGRDVDHSVVSDFYITGYNDEDERKDKRKTFEICFLDKELTGEYL